MAAARSGGSPGACARHDPLNSLLLAPRVPAAGSMRVRHIEEVVVCGVKRWGRWSGSAQQAREGSPRTQCGRCNLQTCAPQCTQHALGAARLTLCEAGQLLRSRQ